MKNSPVAAARRWMPSRSTRSRARLHGGFTLVELLVAMTIFAFMTIFFAQIIGWVTRSWAQGRQLADSLGKGRAAMELITRDLQMGVFRSDLGAFSRADGTSSSSLPATSTETPSYAFFVARSGGTGRTLSLVNYYVNTTTHTLERQAAPVLISETDPANPSITFGTTAIPQMALLTDACNKANAIPAVTDPYATDLVTGIVAFKMYFINSVTTGTGLATAVSYSSSPTANSKAIGVAMIVVDDTTQNILTKQNTFSTLSAEGALSPTFDYGQGLGRYWNSKIDTFFQTSAGLGLPVTVRSGVRVFESVVLIPNGSVP